MIKNHIHRIARSEVGDSVIEYVSDMIDKVCDVRNQLIPEKLERDMYTEAEIRILIGVFLEENFSKKIKKIRNSQQTDSNNNTFS